jgi:hypothetical protein
MAIPTGKTINLYLNANNTPLLAQALRQKRIEWAAIGGEGEVPSQVSLLNELIYVALNAYLKPAESTDERAESDSDA